MKYYTLSEESLISIVHYCVNCVAGHSRDDILYWMQTFQKTAPKEELDITVEERD